ncbi:MAG: DUF362 domain-containing protein [Bacteroidales bacterium]|nr:DUF362 domain-containing protein [Bacteroidales bacterium]
MKNIYKINSVHAWNTRSNGEIRNDDAYGNVDTSPQVVLAILRQLCKKAGIKQEDIFVGDAFTQMYNHCYNKWSAEFPDIHYMTREPMTGREVFTKNESKKINYSDKKSVISYDSDEIVDQIANADYLINIPALKAHRWAGVTFLLKIIWLARKRKLKSFTQWNTSY